MWQAHFTAEGRHDEAKKETVIELKAHQPQL